MPWAFVIVAATAFAGGFALGFYAAGTLERSTKRDIATYVAVGITLLWAASVGAGIAFDHDPSLATHAIMGAAVGYLFGTGNPIRHVLPGSFENGGGGSGGGDEEVTDDGE